MSKTRERENLVESMENSDYSCESQLKARSRKRKSHSASAEESSTEKSKKIRCIPPSEDSSNGYFVEPESDDECYGYGCGIGGDCECPTLAIKQHAAQPVIRSSWAGRFVVYSDLEFTCEVFDGLKACVSTKACAAVRSAAMRLPASINWEKVRRESVWPKSFEPTGDDIALFFFPSVAKHETAYESLMFDLIREDAALTAEVMGSELLLFTSVDLPPLFTRFQGNLYLWGLFRP